MKTTNPTIDLVIGNSERTDRLVFEHGFKIVSDFDTGNPDISAFSYEDVDVIKPIKTRILRRTIHLEKNIRLLFSLFKNRYRGSSRSETLY